MGKEPFSDENELKYSVSKEADFLGEIGLFGLLLCELSRLCFGFVGLAQTCF